MKESPQAPPDFDVALIKLKRGMSEFGKNQNRNVTEA